MSKPIIDGCMALIISGRNETTDKNNIVGDVVKCLKRNALRPDYWMTDVKTDKGNGVICVAENCLRRIDDPEQTTTWEAIEQEFNWNPTKQRVEEHG